MNFKVYIKKLPLILLTLSIFLTLSQCGIYKKTDSRKIPTNAKDRVKKNMEEGKRIKFTNLSGGSGKFEFASSNEMWRASIDILNFVPLNNVDYGGGIIITDWYNNSENNNSSIKIMVQFLSNEIRADGLKVTVYNKNCKIVNESNNCKTDTNESKIGQEIKLAILKKASRLKTMSTKEKVEEFRKNNKGNEIYKTE